jgi:hypothetical protein
MNREDLCWLAGWLEGEGCFYYIMSKGNSPRIMVQAFSTDLDVLQKVAGLMGSKGISRIPPREKTATRCKGNGGYRTEIQADAAAQLMRELLPLMGKRRSEKINETLEKWEARPSKPMKKLCACGCGREVFGGRRILYARRSGACAQRAYLARQAEKQEAA